MRDDPAGADLGPAPAPAASTEGDSIVLIVDDEKGIRELFKDALTRKGYRVVALTNGADAIERLKIPDVKLVFLDIRMSGVNGVQVLEYATEHNPGVPVVMITGYASIDLEQRVNELKPFAILRKPFGLKDILTVTRAALGESAPPQ